MFIEIYIETSPGEYDRLDMFDDENITLSCKLKDYSDLDKVGSIFSQTFTLPPSSKNNLLLNHYFNTYLIRSNKRGIKCKLYINRELFKVGILNILNGKYTNNLLSSYNVNFTTALKTLKDAVGDDLLNNIATYGATYSGPTMSWDDYTVIQSVVDFDPTSNFITPLIASSRIWTYGDGGKNDIGSTASSTADPANGKYIRKEDLKPAVKFKYVVDKIAERYGFSFSVPMIGERSYDNLMVHLVGSQSSTTSIVVTHNRSFLYDFNNYYAPGGANPQVAPFSLTSSTISNFIIGLPNTLTTNNRTEFVITLFANVINDSNNANNLKVTYIDNRIGSSFGNTLHTQTVGTTDGNFVVQTQFSDTFFGTTNNLITDPITSSRPLDIKILFEFDRLSTWSDGIYGITGRFKTYTRGRIYWNYHYQYMTYLNINPDLTVVYNLLSLLPSVKVIDFLRTFIKMFNLRVRQDSYSDNLLYFERPQDWYNDTLDYTKYVSTDYTKDITTLYKDYNFKHITSKYFSNVNYKKANVGNTNGEEFGQLMLTIPNDGVDGKYSIETNAAVTPTVILNGTNMTTKYGFTDAESTTSPTYSAIYTPNLGELSLFYNGGKYALTVTAGSQSGNTASLFMRNDEMIMLPLYEIQEYNLISNCDIAYDELPQYLINSLERTLTDFNLYKYFYTNSLGFKDEVDPLFNNLVYDKNLYSNYYDQLIKRLYAYNTIIKNVTCYLDEYEVSRFDMRNDIIIGEELYSIEDANINIVTGKTTMKLMSYDRGDLYHRIIAPPNIVTDSNPGITFFDSFISGTKSTYKIYTYEIMLDGVYYDTIYTNRTYFRLYVPKSGLLSRNIQIIAIDIFGNRSKPRTSSISEGSGFWLT